MSNIHDLARQLAAQNNVSYFDALSELSRRSHEARARRKARVLGVLHVSNTDRRAFSAVDSPRFWWEDR